MILSDVSVRRPVFAAVLSLLLVVLGMISFQRLSLRELPRRRPAGRRRSRPPTAVPRRSIIETRITQPLEDAIAGSRASPPSSSSSQNGRSQITIEFKLDRDIDAAANDVRDASAGVVGNLPAEADPPEIAKVSADADVMIWLNLVGHRSRPAGAHRLRRTLPRRPLLRSSTAWRASSSAAASATRCASGSTATRSRRAG